MHPENVWRAPPHDIVLANDEVHVWRASLRRPDSEVEELWQTLSEGERCRAERYSFAQDRMYFIAARGFLRAILGRYLKKEPRQLIFSYSRYGKPALGPGAADTAPDFNISHSNGMALFAISVGRKIGVDLEFIRFDRTEQQIAERFFAPREVAALRALPTCIRTEAFFQCWTRKEAYLKAVGKGLVVPLDQFDVSLEPNERPALLHTQWDHREASRWSLETLSPGPEYAATLAVEGADWQLSCWQWPGGSGRQ